MKPYRVAHLSILIIGLAISSPPVIAQVAPDAGLPSAETAALKPSSDPGFGYTAPTEKEKLRRFALDAFGPVAFGKAAVAAGFAQAKNTPSEWGGRWNGFSARVGSKLGISLVSTTTRYGLAEIFREDTRYYACQCTGFSPRFGHALISVLTGRQGKDGHTVFSIPRLVSPYAGSMASLAWYPDRYGVRDGLRMGTVSFVGQVAGNLALEFIYRGPHSLFGRLRSKSPRELAVSSTPQ